MQGNRAIQLPPTVNPVFIASMAVTFERPLELLNVQPKNTNPLVFANFTVLIADVWFMFG